MCISVAFDTAFDTIINKDNSCQNESQELAECLLSLLNWLSRQLIAGENIFLEMDHPNTRLYLKGATKPPADNLVKQPD
jgi:hypothetical protein